MIRLSEPCPQCGGTGEQQLRYDDGSWSREVAACPACHSGMVPDDGTVEAAAKALYELRESWITLKRDPWEVAVKRVREAYMAEALEVLVAAARYQSERGGE